MAGETSSISNNLGSGIGAQGVKISFDFGQPISQGSTTTPTNQPSTTGSSTKITTTDQNNKPISVEGDDPNKLVQTFQMLTADTYSGSSTTQASNGNNNGIGGFMGSIAKAGIGAALAGPIGGILGGIFA